ncbi:hypothetical protein EAG_05564 [Camponotus floridanus]|uniref:Uncharacterized protein n=1 Tax=Camponotus floridanus TaxID=104421 RepID=E1ZZR1_CAMFO|nr:hypothetical protein EAG_05564 [Camponotus floridanus]
MNEISESVRQSIKDTSDNLPFMEARETESVRQYRVASTINDINSYAALKETTSNQKNKYPEYFDAPSPFSKHTYTTLIVHMCMGRVGIARYVKRQEKNNNLLYLSRLRKTCELAECIERQRSIRIYLTGNAYPHSPDGLHVLSCRPTRIDDAAEQDDEDADPDGPR